MAIYPDQLQPFSLNGAGAVTGATTVSLKSMTTIDGALVTMADFGSIGYGTLEPGSGTQEEQVSFTGISQNSNGTATLTGVKNVAFGQPFVETSGLSKSHAGSTVFVISNTSGWYNEIAFKENNENITGYWNVPDPVNNTEIANKQWVLSVVNGGAVSTSSLAVSGTAGEAVSAGKIVYFKVADGRWYLASSVLTGTTDLILLGIAQGTGSTGLGISGGVLIRGIDSNQLGLVQGTIYYLSTAGAISASAGTVERAVGQAASSSSLLFDPDYFYIPTANQKGAFAGYRDTPSSANTFLTSAALYDTSVDQSQLTQDTTVTVGEADATTRHNKLAQSFVPANKRIRGVSLYKSADTGSFTGTVKVALQADSAGIPSGSDLASVTVSNADWLAFGTGSQNFTFASEYTTLATGSLYWIIISTSTADNGNHPNLGANSVGGYPSGSVKYFDTTDGWISVATIDLYFKTYIARVGSIPSGDSNGTIPVEIIPFTSTIINIYTTSTVWNKPTSSAFKYVIVEVQGPGGGGAGVVASADKVGGSGGSGGYAKRKILASFLNVTEVVTVGRGGNGGVGDSDGETGTNSSFGSWATATSGVGGVKSQSTLVAGGIGGTASNGDINVSGKQGPAGLAGGAITLTSGGGSSLYGAGGVQNSTTTSAAGNAGTGNGSGGSGAGNRSNTGAVTGGRGADGIIIVTEYYG